MDLEFKEYINKYSLLINEIKQEFNYQINNINTREIDNISNLIIECIGNIYICGIGKSGNIAKHCSDLLKSISINSFNLDIINALHGDIGTLNKKDIVIIFTKSGNTKELIDILPHFKKRKIKVICICCDKNSQLKELCDITIELPFRDEISGDINKIPTNSYMSHLLFTNILVSLLKKNITKDNYIENHPHGDIGQNLKKISEILIKKFPKFILINNLKLHDILLEMTHHKIGCCFFVNNEDELLGILTDGDIRRALIENENLKLIDYELINKKFYFEDKLNKYVYECKKSNYIPILSNKKIIGIINNIL